jgi:alanine dehydrogenase
MHYITEQDVEKNLGIKETVDILEEAFESFSSGTSFYRPRERIIFEGSVFNTMPGVFQHRNLAGLKTYFANKNGARFVVIIFDTNKAELLAVIEADRLGQIRTGALPAMVTRRMLKKKNQGFCVIGSGYQAETQLEAMASVFDLDSISVYSRTFSNARKFAERMQQKTGLEIKAYENVSQALKDATIVNTITDSNNSIFGRKDLGDEYHVNLCGGNIPSRREADEDIFLDSDLIVIEDMEQAMKESGEIISLMKNHPEKKTVELGDFMKLERNSLNEKKRTVFKTMGIGLEDVAAGYVLMKNMGIL